jgi:hypothetical protein
LSRSTPPSAWFGSTPRSTIEPSDSPLRRCNGRPRSDREPIVTSSVGLCFPVTDKPDIRAQSRDELLHTLQQWGQPDFRTTQIMEWLYALLATRWDQMSNLPLKLRQHLAEHFKFEVLRLVRLQGSRDTTRKFLWGLADGNFIETVLIPANPALYGEPSDRHTLCVSTQVGCAYGCKFCASGLLGWKRNLQVQEIVDQVLAVERNSRADFRQLRLSRQWRCPRNAAAHHEPRDYGHGRAPREL